VGARGAHVVDTGYLGLSLVKARIALVLELLAMR
jgi:hypothetical protein